MSQTGNIPIPVPSAAVSSLVRPFLAAKNYGELENYRKYAQNVVGTLSTMPPAQVPAIRAALLVQLDKIAAELQSRASKIVADLQKIAPTTQADKIAAAIVSGVTVVLPLFGPLVSAAYAIGLKREKESLFKGMSAVLKQVLAELDTVNALRQNLSPGPGASLIAAPPAATNTNVALAATVISLALFFVRK